MHFLAKIFTIAIAVTSLPASADDSDKQQQPAADKSGKLLQYLDIDRDGKVSASESKNNRFVASQFSQLDGNNDQFIDAEELQQFAPSAKNRKQQTSPVAANTEKSATKTPPSTTLQKEVLEEISDDTASKPGKAVGTIDKNSEMPVTDLQDEVLEAPTTSSNTSASESTNNSVSKEDTCEDA